MQKQMQYRGTAVFEPALVGETGGARFTEWQFTAARRPERHGSACPNRIRLQQAGAPDGRGRPGGARFARLLLILAQILIAAFAALLSATPAVAQTDATVPGAPQNLKATPGDGSLTLTWDAPDDDGGSPIVRYDYTFGRTASGRPELMTGDASRTITFDGLTNGASYQFAVYAVNGEGRGTFAVLRAKPAAAPGPVENIGAHASPTAIGVFWDWPTNNGGSQVTGFEYRYAPGSTVPEDTVWQTKAGNQILLTNVAVGTEYTIEVRAINDTGPSEAVAVSATAGILPSAPQSLVAETDDGEVILNWQTPANEGNPAVSGYEYRHAPGASVPSGTAWRSAGTSLTATVGSLTNQTSYTFEVRAVNKVGGGDAAAIAATPSPHPAVFIQPEAAAYRIVEGASGASVAIVARTGPYAQKPSRSFATRVMTNQVSGGATTRDDFLDFDMTLGFSPSDFSAAGTAWEARKTVALTIVDDALDEDNEDFEVLLGKSPGIPAWAFLREADGTTVCNRGGCVATVTIKDNDGVPSAPKGLAAEPGDGEVVLTWQAPASSGDSALTGYEYRHAAGGSVPQKTAWQSAGTDLTVTVGSLVNETEYAFEVRARNDAGEGKTAAIVATPVPAATAPPAPRAVGAMPGDGEVVLIWQAPASNGGSAITGYEYRHAAGDSVPQETAWQSAGTDLTVTVGNLVNETEYAFEVRAVNDVGKGQAASLTATPVSAATVPSAPQDLAAAPGDGVVVLTWQAPASNGGSAITGYEYRHAAGGSVPQGTAWQSAGTDLTVTVGSLANGTKYAFEVRAANDVGEGGPAAIVATPVQAATAPSAPQNLAAQPGDGQVSLTWQAPADSGSENVVRYEYRFVNGGSNLPGTGLARYVNASQWISVGEDRSVTVDGLENGEQYLFEVQAVNDAGASDPASATAVPSASAATVDELQREVSGFMLRRANALASNQPGLTRFLKEGKVADSLSAEVTEQGGTARGSISLGDVWFEAKAAWSDGDGASSRHMFGAMGSHWQVDERLLAGLMFQVDLTDETLPGEAGSIDGKGWLVGPYFAAALEEQPLFFEGRLLYGQTDNHLSHATGVTGSFATERWLAQVRAEGEVELKGGVLLTPYVDLLQTRDSQQRFTDSTGRPIDGQTVGLRQATAGVEFRLPITTDEGEITVVGGLAGIYSATDGGASDAGFAGARARANVGFEYHLDENVSIELKGYYDGIGKSDSASYGLDAALKVRF